LVDTDQRSLIVIDFAGGDKDEERWRGFQSSLRRRAHGESKIIVISRAERHSGLGTVPPLRLRLGAAVPGGRGRPEEKTAYYHPGVPVKGGRSAPCLFYDRRKSTGMSRS